MSAEHNPHEWKEVLALFAGIALVILAIGGCTALGGGFHVKLSDPVEQKGQP